MAQLDEVHPFLFYVVATTLSSKLMVLDWGMFLMETENELYLCPENACTNLGYMKLKRYLYFNP